jgi:hypothetical protein
MTAAPKERRQTTSAECQLGLGLGMAVHQPEAAAATGIAQGTVTFYLATAIGQGTVTFPTSCAAMVCCK